MTHCTVTNEPELPGLDADLQTVLAAWNDATLRLEQTHEALRGEVARLTAELEVKNRELARKNRLADLGQIASHVAHEVRNSLVSVTLYLSLLRRRLAEDAGSLDVLTKVEGGFQAVDSTVNDLLHFAAQRDPVLRRVAIRPLVEQVLSSLAPQLAAQRIATRIEAAPETAAEVDPDLLRRAVLNLALNAIDAMPTGGELVAEVRARDGALELDITDTGPGLSDEVQRRVFEPFFTTKSTGTGLGLAIVYRMAEAHGGEVSVRNCPTGGAAFTLRLPQWAGAKAA